MRIRKVTWYGGYKNDLTLLSHGMWRRETRMEKFLSNGKRKENVKCVSPRKKIKKYWNLLMKSCSSYSN
jgi:hypothetical protein